MAFLMRCGIHHYFSLSNLTTRNLYASCQKLQSTSVQQYTFDSVKVNILPNHVYHVELNRPAKKNAMHKGMWADLGNCFDQLATDSDCRCIVLSGSGDSFTAGIDISFLAECNQAVTSPVFAKDGEKHKVDIARRAFRFHKIIKNLQDSITKIEENLKPVIAAIHGNCIGAGVDLVSTCDIRYCSADTRFQIKEVDLGLAADVGTLQRFPRVIGGDSLFRELAYTGRQFLADEALDCHFVSRVFPDKESLIVAAVQLANVIAAKSPVAVQISKQSIVYAREHGVVEGLKQMAFVNQCMLQSEDLMKTVTAMMSKQTPTFEDV